MTILSESGINFVVQSETFNMKNSLFIVILLLLGSVSVSAQITVPVTAQKLKMNVDDLEELKAPEASSTCGELETKFTDMMFSGGCLGNLVRVYTFTDECGNSAKAECYIQLTDTRGPEFTSTAEDVYADGGEVPMIPQLSTKDNSGQQVKVEVNEETKKDRIIRTWTATDKCGNTSTTQQIIWLNKGKK